MRDCGTVGASGSKDRCFRTRSRLVRKPSHPHAFPGKRRRQLEWKSLRPHASPRKRRRGFQESALPVDSDAQLAAARVARETETRHPAL
ncbi:hypothetical protein NDU88_010121 [Pleurodeles waltl]|uniref:Uncharacterized protein n=1 Tax=Pleurodeles waltl TaxID=8319 RepID=A0AAV7Q112_PLEWA|nr:hypothetical protein NDU88_010121 [Pleurodeles waltl]